LRERFCIRFVLRRDDDGLAASDQMPRQRSTDVADSDNCGCHGDSSLFS
jgi:ribosomal protein L27